MQKVKIRLLFAMLVAFLLLPTSVFAVSGINIDFGSEASRSVGMNVFYTVLLFSALSLAPSILFIVTSFTRLIIVFSFLKSALGLQQSPPSVVLSGLALFLTFFIMQPTFQKAFDEGVMPFVDEKIELEAAWQKSTQPFKDFMLNQTREKDLKLFNNMSRTPVKSEDKTLFPLATVVPAFIISELRRAFEIGFLIFIPFLVIDMVVSSLLMAMGMMMLPPVSISLPFKVVFFVLVDGWHMLSASLMKGFDVPAL